MSNIHYFMGQLDRAWNAMRSRYPGFEKPVVYPAEAIKGMAPMYMRRYIDDDPTSYYMFLKAVPRTGADVSRDKARAFFDELFYEQLGMPSSYDVRAGGEYSRETAIDKEVLPARDDGAFKTYYEEQMEELMKAVGGDPQKAAAEKKKEEDEKFKKEFGFDRNDPDIIDAEYVDPLEPKRLNGQSGTAVGKAQTFAVGNPLPIYYAVDLHVPAGGNALGYGGVSGGHVGGRRPDGYLGGGRRLNGYLGESKKKAAAEEPAEKSAEKPAKKPTKKPAKKPAAEEIPAAEYDFALAEKFDEEVEYPEEGEFFVGEKSGEKYFVPFKKEETEAAAETSLPAVDDFQPEENSVEERLDESLVRIWNYLRRE